MMKPGYKTSEFGIGIITKRRAVFCVAGVITTADEQKLAATATNAVIGVFAIITAGKVIGEYIKGRSSIKANLCLALALLLWLPNAAPAQSPLPRTFLFGCRCN